MKILSYILITICLLFISGTKSYIPSKSGVYTPVLTNVTNIDTSTAYPFNYMRVGNVVTISGKVDFTTNTGGGTPTALGMSLIFASDFSATEQCAGTGFTVTDKEGVIIAADIANNRAELQYEDATASSHTVYITFTYSIIP